MPYAKLQNLILVEDEPVARRVLKRLLTAQGYDVHASPSGEEAIADFEADGPVSAAVVDLELPGMNGVEVVRRLKHAHPEAITVIVTARSPETLHRLGLPFDVPYLQKPIEFSTLLRVLAQSIKETRG